MCRAMKALWGIETKKKAQKKPRTSFGVSTNLKKDPLFKTSKRLSKIARIFLLRAIRNRIIFYLQKKPNFLMITASFCRFRHFICAFSPLGSGLRRLSIKGTRAGHSLLYIDQT